MKDIAGRVLSLIEASGLSRRAFGQRIGLDDSKLSKSLSGARRFSSLDLARIAELCDVTVDWLVTGEEPPLALAARTTTGRRARRLTRPRSGTRNARGPGRVRLPAALATAARHPVYPDPPTYAEQGRSLAGAALGRVADAGRSVADADLPALIEDVFGADVAVVALDEGFDGLSASSDDAKLIVLGTSPSLAAAVHAGARAGSSPRRRRSGGPPRQGHLRPGPGKDPGEVRANSFASAFLMPDEALRAAVGTSGLTEDGFAALACDLKVSPSALAIRLQQLRLIDSGTCDRLGRSRQPRPLPSPGARTSSPAGRGGDHDTPARVCSSATPTRPTRPAPPRSARTRACSALTSTSCRLALESDDGAAGVP